MTEKPIIKPKKCRQCRNKFTPKRSSLEVCCSLECAIAYGKSKPIKVKDTEREKMKIEVKVGENRNALQREINKLSRMIDEKFEYSTCIDCGKSFGAQKDAAHYHDMSTNRGIRYHLSNLHTSRSDCNQYSSKHKVGYKVGLENRYGTAYLEYVENLQFEYRNIKLSAFEIVEKLALVRKIIRNFDTFQFESSLIARNQLNNMIAIYK